MKKITVKEKELVSIKKELDRTSKYWDSLLNLIEPCLLEKEWLLIKRISASNYKCSETIDHIFKSKENWVF